MSYLIAEQTTAIAISDALTTLLDWTSVNDYSDFTIIVKNNGGGSADDIADIEIDQTDALGGASDLDAFPGVPAVPIASGDTAIATFDATKNYVRVRAECANTEDTTATAWLNAEDYTVPISSYALTSLATVKDYMGITSTSYDSVLIRLINAVTSKIENYCGRKFKSRSYTLERHYGSGDTTMYTDQWPIISVERVAVETQDAIQITGGGVGAFSMMASIKRTQDPPVNSDLVLTISGGASAGTNELSFSTYDTMSDLTAAITALGGWTGAVVGSKGHYDPDDLLPVGSIECNSGTITFEMVGDGLDDYSVKNEEGELYRPSGWPRGWRNVYIDYTAGYATVPDDIENVAIQCVRDLFKSRSVNMGFQSERLGDYAYSLAAGGSGVHSVVMRYKEELGLWRRMAIA